MLISLTGHRTHRGRQHILLRRGGALRTLGAFILTAGSISLVLGIYLFRDTLGQPTGDRPPPSSQQPSFWLVVSSRCSTSCDPC